ncbi:MAG: cyclodeaminase/cyclohydrolase family protein [Streptosporangiaceae bacterium]
MNRPAAPALPDYLDMPLRQFLGALAGSDAAPGGGSAAALAVALGAALCGMTARLSARQLADELTAELATDAAALLAQTTSLIQADAQSYLGVLAALRQPGGAVESPRQDGARAEARKQRIAAALSEAAEVPMSIVEHAGQVARLAARLAADGNPRLRGDVISALLLAEAGARAAAVLVGINLADAPEDDRPARAGQMLQDIARTVREELIRSDRERDA